MTSRCKGPPNMQIRGPSIVHTYKLLINIFLTERFTIPIPTQILKD